VNPWSVYSSRIEAQGGNKRNAVLQRERRFLAANMPNSLSYHQLIINGEERGIAVINSDNLNTKTICTMPGEDFPHGGLVEWMDNYWLITQRDSNNELYTKGVMQECNYLLRWVADDESIVERWCIIEDGTKYLTGEYGDNDYIVTRGDSRVSLILPRDDYTVRLNRNDRFLIDDYDSPNVLAYRLTKPFKLGTSYNGGGILSYVLTECNTEDTDNFELHIANYYQHFPREKPSEKPDDVTGSDGTDGDAEDSATDDNVVNDGTSGKKVWL
jgi:hypothetical protein